MAVPSPMPKLLRQESAFWVAWSAQAIASGKTPDQAIEVADRLTAALRERMRSMKAQHFYEDREAQREEDELASKTR